MVDISVETAHTGGIFMTTNFTPFFSLPENQSTLNDFALLLQRRDVLPVPQPNFLPAQSAFIRILASNPLEFDKYCQVNIAWIGKGYIDQIRRITGNETTDLPELLSDVFTSSFRFLCEFDFGREVDLGFELRSLTVFVHDNLDQFKGLHRSQLVYACYAMPAAILKHHLHSPTLRSFKSFEETAQKAEVHKKTLDNSISAQNETMLRLEESAKQLQTKFNFVGLVRGFENLKEAKQKEKKLSFRSAIALAMAMLAPLAVHLWFVLSNLEQLEKHTTMLLFSLSATLGLELVLLYFFRVVLQNFRSIQTQLLQIDLRVSLCQFIQSYAEYSSKIKKDDASALERFEALIFSGLVGEGKDLPTTFDGLEQVAGLIKAMRDK